MNVTHIVVREEGGARHLFNLTEQETSQTPAEVIAFTKSTYWARKHRRAAVVLIAIDGGKKA
jgi:hypothetical protein